jgi:hypothetical protein
MSALRYLAAVAAAACIASSAFAQTTLKPELAGLGFLVGQWKSNDGKVADTGGTSSGTSAISIEADGAALLRRDRTETFDAKGKSTGGFGQIMTIYSENGAVHADYIDGGGHVIHYTSANVVAGKSVTFDTAPGSGPAFRLIYERRAPAALAVSFGIVRAGQFHAIAVGTLTQAP